MSSSSATFCDFMKRLEALENNDKEKSQQIEALEKKDKEMSQQIERVRQLQLNLCGEFRGDWTSDFRSERGMVKEAHPKTSTRRAIGFPSAKASCTKDQ